MLLHHVLTDAPVMVILFLRFDSINWSLIFSAFRLFCDSSVSDILLFSIFLLFILSYYFTVAPHIFVFVMVVNSAGNKNVLFWHFKLWLFYNHLIQPYLLFNLSVKHWSSSIYDVQSVSWFSGPVADVDPNLQKYELCWQHYHFCAK